MDNRFKWTIGMSALGCIAAITTLGAAVTIADVFIGGLTLGGITFLISSIISSTNGGGATLNLPKTSNHVLTASGSYGPEVSEESREFLDSLEIVQGRHDGWYKDPSGFHQLRFFENGVWTLAICDSDSSIMKAASLAALRTNAKKAQKREDNLALAETQIHSQKATVFPQTDLVTQLERLSVLRDSGALTDSEFQLAKQQLIERS